MLNLNTLIFQFINNGAGHYRVLDTLFIAAVSYVTLIIIGLVLAYYLLIYLPWKKEGMERLNAFRNAWDVVWSVALTWIIVLIIKTLVAFPRPFEAIKNLHVLIAQPTDYSFPSGHAAVTMALATAVYFYHKRLGELLFIFAFVVGTARVYVGVHYPLDVAIGFLLGYCIPKLLNVYRYRVK